jgi:hypothetical protein
MKPLFIILLFALLASIDNKIQEKTILVLGPIRSGKSCFVNSMLGEYLAPVGTDDGEQTTILSKSFEGKIENLNLKLKIIDTVAISNNNYSDLFDMINYHSESGQGIDLILLFTSLRDENPSLKLDLDKIKFFLKEMRGISLIVTKTEDFEDKKKFKKLESIDKISESYGLIRNFIVFDSECDGSFHKNLANNVYSKLNKSIIYSNEFLRSRIIEIRNQIKFLDSQTNMSMEEKLKFIYSNNFDENSPEVNEVLYFEIAKATVLILGSLTMSYLVIFRKKVTEISNLSKNKPVDISADVTNEQIIKKPLSSWFKR